MQTFETMELNDRLKQSLYRLDFHEPTEIQSMAIGPGLEGLDIIACAETGSGKTGAFAIPMVERLLADKDSIGLVLAPTRELAQQILKFIQDLTKAMPKLTKVLIVGGADMARQSRQLKRGARIIVATPGRLNDHLSKGNLKLDTCTTLILDEGDRMLDMGFAPQLDQILKYLPKERQTSLFTATLPPKVKKLAEKYLRKDPKHIAAGPISQPVKTVKQVAIAVTPRKKQKRVLEEVNKRTGSMIIFVRTKRRADRLTQFLEDYNVPVDVMHGDRTQGQRNRAIRAFREGKDRILVATDVAARGLDIPHVAQVINFDLPAQEEDYVHRIGRTARNGATGLATTFVAPEDRHEWKLLVRNYGIEGELQEDDPDQRAAAEEESLNYGRPRGRGGRSGRGASGGGRERRGGDSRDRGPKRKTSQKAASPQKRRKSRESKARYEEGKPRDYKVRSQESKPRDSKARFEESKPREPKARYEDLKPRRSKGPARKGEPKKAMLSDSFEKPKGERYREDESRPRKSKDKGKKRFKNEENRSDAPLRKERGPKPKAETPREERRAKAERNANAKWKPSPKKRKTSKSFDSEEYPKKNKFSKRKRESDFSFEDKPKKKLRFAEKLNFKAGKSKLKDSPKFKGKPKAKSAGKPGARRSKSDAPSFGVPGKKKGFGKKRGSQRARA